MKSKNIDMGSGRLFINIWRFAFPFMLTGLLQQLYNAADVIVVGRYAGQEALAGVGTTGSLISLIINLFLGLSAGVSVAMGKALGSGDEESAQKVVHTSILLSILGGAVISVIGIVFAHPLLKLIDVPDNVMPHAGIYMQISFTGKIPLLIYNFGSAILRAKGDTKRPLYIVMISGIINVVLNVIFVTQFGMKADGVALATVISQIFNAIVIIYLLRREDGFCRLRIRKLAIYKKPFIDIIRVGVPSGIQSIVFALSNVIIQANVNGFGSAAIAGSAAAANLGNFYYVALNSFYHASVSFVSYNVGARKYNRISKIVTWCVVDVVLVGVAEAFITVFLSERIIGLYLPGQGEALELAMTRHMIVGTTYWICGAMEVMCGALRGIGRSLSGMIISIAGVCGVRILWVATFFKAIGTYQSLFFAWPLSWLATTMMHTVMFIYARRKLKEENTNDKI